MKCSRVDYDTLFVMTSLSSLYNYFCIVGVNEIQKALNPLFFLETRRYHPDNKLLSFLCVPAGRAPSLLCITEAGTSEILKPKPMFLTQIFQTTPCAPVVVAVIPLFL